ncbi:flagellar hook-length control protein FliK [Ramlibacter tataouinensis]|uniref:flagellar hook-length control protein FliK n=1 Tax=Ramlibacter tataouinensis TaxID=94132 RepID=UPI0022F39845|nr:flagellar hook-length control protein FliK [Ramlibacter tataouinensis]WBY00613.1 flagellar hook-length control protein FliK [Ramlibacter tataouinensis]
MNVPAVLSPTVNAAARNDVPPAGESGAFAEVLERRMKTRSDAVREDLATPLARPARTRRPQEAGEREALEAGMSPPLIAAALDPRQAAAGGAVAAAGPVRTALATGVHDAPAGPRLDTAGAQALRPAPRGGEAEPVAAPLSQAAAGAAAAGATEHDVGDRAGRAAFAPAFLPATPAARPVAGGGHAAQAAAGAVPPQGRPAEAEAAARRPDTSATGASFTLAAPADPDAAAGPAAGSDAPVLPGSGTAPAAPFAAAAAAPAATGFPAAAAELPLAGQAAVEPPVGSRAWPSALGQALTGMHHRGQGQAQLELNPPGLGPLSVTLSVADQQAQALFVSPHAAVRAALEAALPQLRAALADSGIALGQASVGAEHQPASGGSPQSQHDPSAQRRPASPGQAPAEVPAAATRPPAGGGSGGHAVDTFA